MTTRPQPPVAGETWGCNLILARAADRQIKPTSGAVAYYLCRCQRLAGGVG
jgi:hypothetical protein